MNDKSISNDEETGACITDSEDAVEKEKFRQILQKT